LFLKLETFYYESLEDIANIRFSTPLTKLIQKNDYMLRDFLEVCSLINTEKSEVLRFFKIVD